MSSAIACSQSIGLPWPATGIFGDSPEANLSRLTSFAEASPVRQSPSQASGKELPMSDGFGRSSLGSFAWYDPATCSLRTSQGCLAPTTEERWPKYSGTWPTSGTMRNGSCFERPTLGPVIEGPECSLWPTTNAHDGRRPGSDATSTQNGNLKLDAEQWQTPATDSFRSRGLDRKDEMGLDQQARFWATPRREDGESCGNHPGAQDSLTGQARMWPTATSRDWKSGESSVETLQRNARPLNEKAQRWKTPHGMMGVDATGHKAGVGGEFVKQVHLWTTPTTDDTGSRTRPYAQGGSPLSLMVQHTELRPAISQAEAESGLRGMAHGLSNRTHRLRALGNAVVPAVAQWIGECIMETWRVSNGS